MTVIKINAITVPENAGDELARRFAARAGAVDNQDGFEGFELLRPTDERHQWLVITRWRDEETFSAWVNSPAFAHGHCARVCGGWDRSGTACPFPPTTAATAGVATKDHATSAPTRAISPSRISSIILAHVAAAA